MKTIALVAALTLAAGPADADDELPERHRRVQSVVDAVDHVPAADALVVPGDPGGPAARGGSAFVRDGCSATPAS